MNRREFTGALAGAVATFPLRLPAQGQPSPLPQFSVMLWTLAKVASLDRSLGMVAEAGFGGVELVGEFHRWTPEEVKRNVERLTALHLRVDAMSGVSAGFSEPAVQDQFLAQFQEQLRWAQQLQCPQIILLSGANVPGLPPERQTEASVEALRRASDLALKQNVEIVIEPIDRLESPAVFLSSVSEAFRIVRATGRPNVRVLYDLYHEQRGYGNLTEKLEENIDLVHLVHVADVPGRHEPGTGEIHFENLYRHLAALRYTRYIAMEFYPTGDPVATLRQAREQVVRAYGRA